MSFGSIRIKGESREILGTTLKSRVKKRNPFEVVEIKNCSRKKSMQIHNIELIIIQQVKSISSRD
jgi:hypothetical protein